MKAIMNEIGLISRLDEDNPKWREILLDSLHVELHNNNGCELMNACGSLDLDCDAEYCYLNGNDCTKYIVVNSINELIEYIRDMPSYEEYLVDTNFGCFSKTELFKSIQQQVISVPENTSHEDGSPEWSLYRISNSGTLEMAIVDCDNTYFDIELRNRSISEVISELVGKMTQIALPDYTPVHYHPEIAVTFD